MLVRDRMSSPAVTIRPKTTHQDALRMMHDCGFRRLPVVSKKGKLAGIVSERDLLYASPSSATSLNVWEITSLLSRLCVREIMTRDVITTTPATPVEDAAHLMEAAKVGGLPVVDEKGYVVGVITETDIFRAFVEMFAGGQSGLRLTLQIPTREGVLPDLCRGIEELGGQVESVGSFRGDTPDRQGLVVKVRNAAKDELVELLEALGDHVVDARDV